MKSTWIFFLYLLVCLALGALLTYPVMQTGWVESDPNRVMGRLAQVFILIGLWPFLRSLGLNNAEALGFGARRPLFVRSVALGWLMGVAILLVLALTLLALQVRVPDAQGADWLASLSRRALQALVGGLLIGLLEETFFRGALYSAVRRRGSVLSAVFWTAFLYALLHFMKPHPLPDGMALDWDGVAHMFAHVFTGVFQWKHVDSMAALFLVGVFLGLVRERTGHIGWCIGLHAGWVLVIQVTRHLTDGNDASLYAFLVGDYDGMIGWLAAGWIGLLALGFGMLARSGLSGRKEWRKDREGEVTES
jgi:membrane protease YdiL (CAAX protease family)